MLKQYGAVFGSRWNKPFSVAADFSLPRLPAILRLAGKNTVCQWHPEALSASGAPLFQGILIHTASKFKQTYSKVEVVSVLSVQFLSSILTANYSYFVYVIR